MTKNVTANCGDCTVPGEERACLIPKGKGIQGCPTKGKKRLIEQARREYRPADIHEFARQASIQEGECYGGREKRPYVMHPVKPRMLEVCEFAHKMNYRLLGLVFCIGLRREAEIVNRILRKHGFGTVSVACKVGAVSKEEIGVKDGEQIRIGEHESMCNPILQAMIVNDAKTDFNILLGLCVGHDSLFFKYSDAPATVLAVKDRVTGHNPLACIYTSETYYAWLNP